MSLCLARNKKESRLHTAFLYMRKLHRSIKLSVVFCILYFETVSYDTNLQWKFIHKMKRKGEKKSNSKTRQGKAIKFYFVNTHIVESRRSRIDGEEHVSSSKIGVKE
jgi:hypothetical protein